MFENCAETVSQKADRLRRNYRVILTGPNRGLVIGDHDTYEVAETLGGWTCTCPWGRYKGHLKSCSHVVAARRALKDPVSQAPVVRLAEMLVTSAR
ncbi:MAG: hypothetical protein HY319_17650 [Armatimonadetes bacterium]|nr:hypothetical protein [Armatimonadota bacterium]